MTPETIAILAVGASLAVLIWQGQRAAKEDRARLETRLQAVEHGLAKLEGLLEGLREAIAGRHAA